MPRKASKKTKTLALTAGAVVVGGGLFYLASNYRRQPPVTANNPTTMGQPTQAPAGGWALWEWSKEFFGDEDWTGW